MTRYAVRARDAAGNTGNATVAIRFQEDEPAGSRRWVIQSVAWALRHWRVNVVDGLPDWMWPGDYLTVEVGPHRWMGAGIGGWCPRRLENKPWGDRINPWEVFIRLANPLSIAHEVVHWLNNGHSTKVGNLMSHPISGWDIEPSQLWPGWHDIRDFCQRTPLPNRFAAMPADAGIEVEFFNPTTMNPLLVASMTATEPFVCRTCVATGVRE